MTTENVWLEMKALDPEVVATFWRKMQDPDDEAAYIMASCEVVIDAESRYIEFVLPNSIQVREYNDLDIDEIIQVGKDWSEGKININE